MSDLKEWFGAIEESGKQQRVQDDETRKKFLDAPHNTVQVSEDVKMGVWAGIDCVVTIPFYPGEKGKLNIHAVQYFELDLIEVMSYARDKILAKKDNEENQDAEQSS
jgi:hypothetical protein